MRGPSGSSVQHHPPTCPVRLPGLQLVILESGCVPVIVNEAVDAKKKHRSVTPAWWVHLLLLHCWLVYVLAEIYHNI